MSLVKLCVVFFYIGLFTIGGGQVAITLMQQELMDKGFISGENFFNMVAISESTPGPIGINMATFVGCQMHGIFGGILATFFTVLPSLIIILFIAGFMAKIQNNVFVKAAFSTIRPVVAGLIGVACWSVIKLFIFDFVFAETIIPGFTILSFLKNIPIFLFYIVGTVILLTTKIHPVFLVFLGAIFGIVFL